MIKQQRQLFNDIADISEKRLWHGVSGLQPNDMRILKDVAQRVEWESTDQAETENAKLLIQEIEEFEAKNNGYTPLDKSELKNNRVTEADEYESDEEYLFCAINDCLASFQSLITSGEFNYDNSTELFDCFATIVNVYKLPIEMDVDDFMSMYVDNSPLGDEPSDVSY